LRRPREWGKITEVALIILWAHWLGAPYLNYQETQWPVGGEFGFQLQSHRFWDSLRECGLCALWNGKINGGYPALAETYGAPLHPLVAVTTLGWGTVVGARLIVVYSFCLAGVAQWWMAKAMGLRWPARLWSGLAAVVGGHITGRMDLGGIILVLSAASASLALAAMLDLGLTRRRKSAVLLGVFGALTLVSGQGYMQAAMLGWTPFLLLFALGDRIRLRSLLKECFIALILAVMLAGVFLVPLLHFWPNIQKAADLSFRSAQPLEYIPLNLVIRDIDLMKTRALGTLGIPHLYNLYIGWVPILLAGFALILRRPADRRALAFLVSGSAALFVLASALPFRWLLPLAPWLATIKHTPLLAVLAVPGILGLGAYGLDALIRLPLPSLRLRFRRGSRSLAPELNSAWLLTIPLALGLHLCFDLSRAWLGMVDAASAYDIASRWRTSSLEWVQPPWGVHYWLEAALDEDLKVSVAWYPWAWEGRDAPLPRIEASQTTAPPNAIYQWTQESVRTYLHEGRHYAYLADGAEAVPCEASGGAGNILVRCPESRGGVLHVEENAWDGWYAWAEGNRVELLPAERLSVQATPGEHSYRFRYLPWDAALGLALTLAGCAATIALYIRADRRGA
jgi:hypothetical protein